MQKQFDRLDFNVTSIYYNKIGIKVSNIDVSTLIV